MGTDIELLLPADVYDALYGANAPASGNVFATINDLAGFVSGNLYTIDGTVPDGRKVTLDGSLNFRDTGDANDILKLNTDGSITMSNKTAYVITMGEIGDAWSEFKFAYNKVSSDNGTTWTGHWAYSNGVTPDVQIGMFANKFGHTAIRTSHDLTFETEWTGAIGTASSAKMRLKEDGNLLIGTGSNGARLNVVGSDNLSATNAFQVAGLGSVGVSFISKNDGRAGIGATHAAASVKFNIKGQGTGAGTYNTWMQNSAGAVINWFRDDGAVHLAQTGLSTRMGSATNYFLQSVQETLQFSNTATRTGFHANRGGTAQIAMRATSASSVSDIASSGSLVLWAGWNGNFSSGTTDATKGILINSTSFNVGIGAALVTTNPASKLTVYGGDTEMTGSANGIILESPDATRYRVTMLDGGTLDINAA
jgi:hypothetical protein